MLTNMRRSFVALSLFATLGLAPITQAPKASQAPQASSKRPDAPQLAPYVPTPQDVVDRMLKLAGVTSKDYVIDLGCGDGRIPVSAAKQYGARGLGVDID